MPPQGEFRDNMLSVRMSSDKAKLFKGLMHLALEIPVMDIKSRNLLGRPTPRTGGSLPPAPRTPSPGYSSGRIRPAEQNTPGRARGLSAHASRQFADRKTVGLHPECEHRSDRIPPFASGYEAPLRSEGESSESLLITCWAVDRIFRKSLWKIGALLHDLGNLGEERTT